MSEQEQNIYNFIEGLFAKQRDFPQTETLSKQLYALQGDLKVHTEILERIETQVLKTNGRCTQNEKDIAEIRTWRDTINGKLVMIGVFCAFISPFIFWFITKKII
jgi:hypothetical protein